MTAKMPESKEFSKRQILFTRYFTAILIDLTVLNLFDEYSDKVEISSFTISLLAAVVLQLMLQLTFKIEHGVGAHFLKKGRRGLRILSAWALLFGSKLAILWVLDVFFGDQILFLGPYHGILTFILVIVTMLVAEALVRWFTHSILGKGLRI